MRSFSADWALLSFPVLPYSFPPDTAPVHWNWSWLQTSSICPSAFAYIVPSMQNAFSQQFIPCMTRSSLPPSRSKSSPTLWVELIALCSRSTWHFIADLYYSATTRAWDNSPICLCSKTGSSWKAGTIAQLFPPKACARPVLTQECTEWLWFPSRFWKNTLQNSERPPSSHLLQNSCLAI